MDMPSTVCIKSRKAFRFFVDVMGHIGVEPGAEPGR
jgi:hypothetical protein